MSWVTHRIRHELVVTNAVLGIVQSRDDVKTLAEVLVEGHRPTARGF